MVADTSRLMSILTVFTLLVICVVIPPEPRLAFLLPPIEETITDPSFSSARMSTEPNKIF